MKRSVFQGLMTAAVIAAAMAVSGQAAAEHLPDAVTAGAVAESSAPRAPFGAAPAFVAETAINAGLDRAMEQQAAALSLRAQNRAEASYVDQHTASTAPERQPEQDRPRIAMGW